MKTRNEISELVGKASSLVYGLLNTMKRISVDYPLTKELESVKELDKLLMGLQDGLEPTLTEIEEHKKADLYDMLWLHITKELEADPRDPAPSEPLESEKVQRWDFWARIWYALRQRIDVGRYPDAVRSPTQPDDIISITDMTHHELMVAYYG